MAVTSSHLNAQNVRQLRDEYAASVWGIIDADTAELEVIVNSQLIDTFHLADEVPSDLSTALENALRVAGERRHQRRLKSDLQKQNIELTAMAERLEDLVSERTADILRSKQELEGQTQRIQQLVRFVNDLSRWHDVDELLMYLRSELRTFHELKEPTLFWIMPRGEGEIVFWQGPKPSHRITSKTPQPATQLRLHDRTDQVFLAEVLGRPVGRTIVLPLAAGPRLALLFLEHSLSEAKLQLLQRFLEERLQVLQITWERIYGEREALQASLQWEKAFDSFADPIAILDADFKTLRANKKFLKHKGERCFERWAHRTSPCPGCPVHENKSAEPQLIQMGERLWYVYSYPIDDQPRPAYVNHYVDVTDTKKLFERSVQNEKMAALGLLAGHIAHELNNPLTGIRGLAQVVRKEVTDKQLEQDLAEVENAAERSQKIIANFLEFSRGSARLETTDLSDVVRKTLPLLKTAFREHRTNFEWSDVELPVHVEVHLLQRVVFNLVNNACQAMPNSGTLELTTLLDKHSAILSVKDTGSGMPEEVLKRIFEPFYTTKREGEGTGLGLSLSRSIVEGFGGRIEVSTQVGKGSEFRVVLPLAEVEKRGAV